VQILVVGAAERYGEFIADLAPQCACLSELEVVGVRRRLPANQAWLLPYKVEMDFALPSDFLGQCQAGFRSSKASLRLLSNLLQDCRGLLSWTQQKLAQRAGVGIVTVRQLEANDHEPRRCTTAVVRAAFEAAGVEFIDENDGGAGVRLPKPTDN
jgi:DNA-binding XRE family transcriptional regulator